MSYKNLYHRDLLLKRTEMEQGLKNFKEACLEVYMAEYNRELRLLRERCGELGHKKGIRWGNSSKESWYFCPVCGIRVDPQGREWGE